MRAMDLNRILRDQVLAEQVNANISSGRYESSAIVWYQQLSFVRMHPLREVEVFVTPSSNCVSFIWTTAALSSAALAMHISHASSSVSHHSKNDLSYTEAN